MPQHPRTPVSAAVVLALTLAVAACGVSEPSPSAVDNSASDAPGTIDDLSVIACATADPTGVGELTGAWSGNGTSVYYIRQVGDCVWWFGTEIEDIEPGVTGQPGFANVASGRFDGNRIVVEWADVPLGSVVNGGGLTFAYSPENGTLTLTEQRGGKQAFGDTVLTRIDPNASPAATPNPSPSP